MIITAEDIFEKAKRRYSHETGSGPWGDGFFNSNQWQLIRYFFDEINKAWCRTAQTESLHQTVALLTEIRDLLKGEST